MIIYKKHEQPGCGGCLLLSLLFLLLIGGIPLVFKVLGTLIFLVFFLVAAAIVAFVVFSYYVKKQISTYEQSQTETHNAFVTLLINILVKIAELDKSVSKAEVNIIHNFFRYHLNYSHTQMLWVKELVKEARNSPYTVDDLLGEFKQQFAYEPRLILLELVFQMLFTKDFVLNAENELTRKIAAYLQISSYDFQAIQSKYLRQRRQAVVDEDGYYAVLGLNKGAPFEEIKAAYRKLSQKYHPDKVSHLGDEFRNVAEERMKELNIAYQFLKKRFAQ